MENDKEKKRSFEEILSDLNSLLEKMPDIINSKKNKDHNTKESIENIEKDNIELQQPLDEKVIDNANIKSDSIIENQQSKEEIDALSELDVEKDTINLNLDEVQVFDPNILLNEDMEESKNDGQIDDIKNEVMQSQEKIQENIPLEELKDKEIKDNGITLKDDLSANVELDVKDVDIDLSKNVIETKEESKIVKKVEDEFSNIEINVNEVTNEEIKKETSNINVSLSIELNSIIAKEAPSNIPEERIKKVGFVLSGPECNLKKLLEIIDEICFSSETKPMFIKRSFIINYDVDFNTDTLILNAKENKVDAVVVVGELPMDKLYEIENVVTSNNMLFFNFKKENIFDHFVIDFIMELIVR